MCPFIWCVFNDTLRHYASIPAYIPGVHPGIIPHTIPDVYPPVCILGVYPRCVSSVCIQACTRRAFRSTSSVQSYLRSNLTADSRTSLVPAMFHFLSIFITFIPFHSISMFERFMNCIVSFHMVCRLRYNVSFTIHLAIMHQSGDHPRRPSPAYIPGVHPRRPSPVCIPVCIPAQLRHPFRSISSVLSYLRSYLTADSRTSLVPAIFHFYFHFYYFHSISMFERFMKYNVSFTIHCVQHQISRTSILYSTFFIIF